MNKNFTDSIDKLFGSWGKGISGKEFVNKSRNNNKDKKRDLYIKKCFKTGKMA